MGAKRPRTPTKLRRKRMPTEHERTQNMAGQEETHSLLDKETIRKAEEVILDNVAAIRSSECLGEPIETNKWRAKSEG